MCEFFVKADPIQYEQRSRTVRMHGVLTSIRLENMVWDILAEMAAEEGRTTNALISMFHDEILAQRGEVPNFASFLRVTCMRYLRRKVATADAAPGVPEAVEPCVEVRLRANGAGGNGCASVSPATRSTVVPIASRS